MLEMPLELGNFLTKLFLERVVFFNVLGNQIPAKSHWRLLFNRYVFAKQIAVTVMKAKLIRWSSTDVRRARATRPPAWVPRSRANNWENRAGAEPATRPAPA